MRRGYHQYELYCRHKAVTPEGFQEISKCSRTGREHLNKEEEYSMFSPILLELHKMELELSRTLLYLPQALRALS